MVDMEVLPLCSLPRLVHSDNEAEEPYWTNVLCDLREEELDAAVGRRKEKRVAEPLPEAEAEHSPSQALCGSGCEDSMFLGSEVGIRNLRAGWRSLKASRSRERKKQTTHKSAHRAVHAFCVNESKSLIFTGFFDWSGREDLNLRPPGPEPDSKSYRTLLKSVDLKWLILNLLHIVR